MSVDLSRLMCGIPLYIWYPYKDVCVYYTLAHTVPQIMPYLCVISGLNGFGPKLHSYRGASEFPFALFAYALPSTVCSTLVCVCVCVSRMHLCAYIL